MPEDPRCPRCGRKVGAFATTCIHCRADFVEPVEGTVDPSAEGIEREPAPRSRTDRPDSGGQSDSEDPVTGGPLDELALLVSRLHDVFLLTAASLQVMITYRRGVLPAVPAGTGLLRRAVGFLDASETRRDGLRVAIGVVATAGLVLLAVPQPVLGLLAGLGLTGFLFTRETAEDVVSAAAYGGGLSLVAVGLGHGIGTGILTGSSIDTSIRTWGRVLVTGLAGTALVLAGGWLDAVAVADSTDGGGTDSSLTNEGA